MELVEKFLAKGADFLFGVIVGGVAVLGLVWKAITDGKLVSGNLVDKMTQNQHEMASLMRRVVETQEDRRWKGD